MPTNLRAHAEAVLRAAFPNMNPAIIAVAAKQPAILTALAALHDEAVRAALEAAAVHAICAFDDRSRSRPDNIDWNDGHRDGTRDAAAKVRAIDPASLREGV
ncbi:MULTISPECIES: hypothetical protein [unclassified Novosphingobium]|uniref:hypothetical protein n=1 Tax=unclassified Novosphingobium TaxID=2644732 RepID=UPI000D46B38D|nr:MULTISPECIES: hypothetical protein [unclassified Novosphingobium]PTR06425.1 hypothetical protein C8K11_12038 [Novosphingobium sp. GV055]PUA94844.1 hypothetical protein C8K12_12038 [Novosphingobium sp. GV061]PUB13769.1 hypothetical protein C8K14_12038 [Novosphingobium sp. GV079]PUB38467.1 hypothetical protein C8K10_12038 [Novosphingobium sp. GV027]